MSKILCLDTETSGLFDYSKRAHEEGQPRMIQLCTVLAQDDGTIIDRFTHSIKPDGWQMDDELAAKMGNGLTHAHLLEIGVPVRNTLDAYLSLYFQADKVIAYGTAFDTKVLRAELRRAGLPDLYGEKPEFCVMTACKPICGLTNKQGRPKNPKLSEAVKIILGRDLEGAHTAEADCLATLELYFALQARGIDVAGKKLESKITEAAGQQPAVVGDFLG